MDWMPDFSEGDAKGHRMHAIVGVFLGFLGPILLMNYFGPLGALGLTFMGANAIFVAKELYDMKKPHPTGFSVSDIVAGNVGLLPMLALMGVGLGA